jgi:D-3-phosphoglycerate dehydrogenase
LLQGLDVKVFTHSAKGEGQLSIRLREFDVLVLIRERTRLRRSLLSKLPQLKLICQTGRLGNHIDLEAAKEFGIEVIEGVGDPVAPAELTWALIMAASRKIPAYSSLLKQGLWQTSSINPTHNTLGRALKNRILGIWGYGKIGQLVASYANAFGMQIQVWGSEQSRALAIQDGYQAAQSQQSFFSSSDVVSLHCRLSESTRHMIGLAELSLMKHDALIVNTSRAELITPGALEQALKLGKPGYAACDVYETEPLTPENEILKIENALLTPHIGFVEQQSYEQYFRPLFEAIVDFVNAKSVSSH